MEFQRTVTTVTITGNGGHHHHNNQPMQPVAFTSQPPVFGAPGFNQMQIPAFGGMPGFTATAAPLFGGLSQMGMGGFAPAYGAPAGNSVFGGGYQQPMMGGYQPLGMGGFNSQAPVSAYVNTPNGLVPIIDQTQAGYDPIANRAAFDGFGLGAPTRTANRIREAGMLTELVRLVASLFGNRTQAAQAPVAQSTVRAAARTAQDAPPAEIIRVATALIKNAPAEESPKSYSWATDELDHSVLTDEVEKGYVNIPAEG